MKRKRTPKLRKTIPYYLVTYDKNYGLLILLSNKNPDTHKYHYKFKNPKSKGYICGWDHDQYRFVCREYNKGPNRIIRGTWRYNAYQKYFSSYAANKIPGLRRKYDKEIQEKFNEALDNV